MVARSDDLPALRRLLKELGDLAKILGESRQVRLVIDTNIVLRELRFLASGRRKSGARTQLLELVESQTVLLYAPRSMSKEVEEHLPRIASECGASAERLTSIWALYKGRIRFRRASLLRRRRTPEYKTLQARDPDDVPFLQVRDAVNAAGILTEDRDFASSGTGVDVLVDLRDYARAEAVALQIKIGGTVLILSMGSGAAALGRAMVSVVAGLRRAPAWVHLIVGGALAFVFMHPGTRTAVLARLADLRRACGDALAALQPIIENALRDATSAEEDANAAWARAEGKLFSRSDT